MTDCTRPADLAPGSLRQSTGDKVNRIYMEKEFTRGDTAFHQKLTWKSDAYFYIVSIKQPNNGPAVTSMEKVIWDPQYFSEE